MPASGSVATTTHPATVGQDQTFAAAAESANQCGVVMINKTTVAIAGNTFAPALAALKSAGFAVTVASSNGAGEVQLLQAENSAYRLIAEDALQLLGLAKLVEVRGNSWLPEDSEVEEFLRLMGNSAR